jgi:hypothetical protein
LKHELIKKRFGDVSIKDEHGEVRTIRTRLKKKTTRPICYASHQDALIYSWYSYNLHDLLEDKILKLGLGTHVLAYRSIEQKCNIHFAKDAFDFIQSQKACVAIAFDVKSFFDTLNHTILKQAWCELLKVDRLPDDHFAIFKSMTRFQFVNLKALEEKIGKEEFETRFKDGRLTNPKEFREVIAPLIELNPNFITKKVKDVNEDNGIPQGSPLSAVLSNLHMLEADQILAAYTQQCGGYYRRYCDDLLIVVPDGHEAEAYKLIKDTVEGKVLKLKLNEGKTEIRFFSSSPNQQLAKDENGAAKPLQYLGLEFDGKDIRLRPASLSRYHHRLRRNVRKAGSMAFGKHSAKDGKIFKRTLYNKYTKIAKPSQRNFIRYAEKAYEITKSKALKRQYQGCVELVNECVKAETARRQRKRSKAENYTKRALPNQKSE